MNEGRFRCEKHGFQGIHTMLDATGDHPRAVMDCGCNMILSPDIQEPSVDYPDKVSLYVGTCYICKSEFRGSEFERERGVCNRCIQADPVDAVELKEMGDREKTVAFINELGTVVNRYHSEFDMPAYAMLGAIEVLKWKVTKDTLDSQ